MGRPKKLAYLRVSWWLLGMNSAPASAWRPSENGSRRVCTLPPGRARASRIVTSWPACVSSYPATSPASPAPRTTTFFGARACTRVESGVVRAFKDEQAERLAAASPMRPRKSRRLIHVRFLKGRHPLRPDSRPQAVRSERLGARAGRAGEADRLSNTPTAHREARGHIAAGHEPPNTPIVEGLGSWSWMFPPPPVPPPNLWWVTPESKVE